MFQQCSTSTHRHIDSLCPAPGSWNSRSHAGDVWRRRGPWHVPCGVPCCDRLTIDGLWSCNSCATVGSGSSGSSGSFVSACWGCCTACVLSQSWPFRCHFQRCKDIWKRWRSQTSHDFGHLRTTSTSVWPFGSICPILSIVSILWFRPGRFRCSQPVFSPFSLLVFFAFKSLQHFKMFYNIFQHVFQDVSSLPELLSCSASFSAVQELRAELQTLEQGVGSNDGEADLDGSGWIWMDLGRGLNATVPTAAYRCSRYIMVYLWIIHVYHIYIYRSFCDCVFGSPCSSPLLFTLFSSLVLPFCSANQPAFFCYMLHASKKVCGNFQPVCKFSGLWDWAWKYLLWFNMISSWFNMIQRFCQFVRQKKD